MMMIDLSYDSSKLPTLSLCDALELFQSHLEKKALELYPSAAPVHQAAKYSLQAGGKRFRPLLLLGVAQGNGFIVKSEMDSFLQMALALEMAHTYSLIHDDLPAMDDDDFRRGMPSCHKVYGEAQAILAGDALLTDSFGMIAEINGAVSLFAKALGGQGMVLGQSYDMCSLEENAEIDVKKIHQLKTGKLIQACVLLGSLKLQKTNPQKWTELASWGKDLGYGFQLRDDLRDQILSRESLGKTPGKDIEQGKKTVFYGKNLDQVKSELVDLGLKLTDQRKKLFSYPTPILNDELFNLHLTE